MLSLKCFLVLKHLHAHPIALMIRRQMPGSDPVHHMGAFCLRLAWLELNHVQNELLHGRLYFGQVPHRVVLPSSV